MTTIINNIYSDQLVIDMQREVRRGRVSKPPRMGEGQTEGLQRVRFTEVFTITKEGDRFRVVSEKGLDIIADKEVKLRSQAGSIIGVVQFNTRPGKNSSYVSFRDWNMTVESSQRFHIDSWMGCATVRFLEKGGNGS